MPEPTDLQRAVERLTRAAQRLQFESTYLGAPGHRAGLGLAAAQSEFQAAMWAYNRAVAAAEQ